GNAGCVVPVSCLSEKNKNEYLPRGTAGGEPRLLSCANRRANTTAWRAAKKSTVISRPLIDGHQASAVSAAEPRSGLVGGAPLVRYPAEDSCTEPSSPSRTRGFRRHSCKR